MSASHVECRVRYPGDAGTSDTDSQLVRPIRPAKVSRHVRLHGCTLLALATAGALVLYVPCCARPHDTALMLVADMRRSNGKAKTEEGALVAKSLLAFHGLAFGVNLFGLSDGSSPSWMGVFLSPNFLLALGFGAIVFRGADK